jgi:uncharacterized protein (DUF433 family)/predicted nuclease of predicted toxin-antitoxin system
MPVLPNPLITSSPDRLGGTVVFAGTRVPVQSLIDYLGAGHPLDHFLDEFPSVSREHAVAVLELAKHILISPAA